MAPTPQPSRTRMPPASVGKKPGFVFQDFNLLWIPCLSRTISFFLWSFLADRSRKWWARSIASVGSWAFTNSWKIPLRNLWWAKQRVAVARAIITSPEILLADEPTGALDSKSSAALLDVFEDINSMGQTILMVTHSTAAAARAKRVLFIKDGILYNQIFRGENRASDVPRNLGYLDGHGKWGGVDVSINH